jgi:hypothetical protein
LGDALTSLVGAIRTPSWSSSWTARRDAARLVVARDDDRPDRVRRRAIATLTPIIGVNVTIAPPREAPPPG